MISIRKLSKDYGNGPVLQNIDLDIEKGESVVIIGGEPSGSHVERAASIHIPMPGNYESINAAQAATVLLFESVRRREAAEGR